MRELIKLSLLLALVCAVCAALLSFVDKKTEGPRKATAEAKRSSAALAVLPSFDSAKAELISTNAPVEAFILRDKATGELIGAAVEGCSPNGYAGEIRLIVGFDKCGTLVDFAVVAAQETPGLGAKIKDDAFRAGFKGRPLETKWNVKKDGGTVDAITSATITSRAACEAVTDAAAKFKKLL